MSAERFLFEIFDSERTEPKIATIVDSLLGKLENLDDPKAYCQFRDHLGDFDLEVNGETDSKTLAWLQAATSQNQLNFEHLVEDLDDPSRLGLAASFCLVERFGDCPEVIQDLILGLTPHQAPKINRNGSIRVIQLIGLSGKTELIPLLKRVFRENYHYHPPSWTARALKHLSAKVDDRWFQDGDSITVSASGSSLVIHHDSRFTGSSNCPDCQWFPCRINSYYRGAIQDCKLWNKTSPAEFLEIKDYRPEDERGPTFYTEEPSEVKVEQFCRQAEHLSSAGQLREAAEAWRLAARHAPETNEQLRWINQAMRTLIKAGDRPAAYALATLAEDKSRSAGDRAVLRSWERTRLGLQEDLGVYVASQRNRYPTARGRIQADLLARFRHGPGKDPYELSSAANMVERHLSQASDDDWLTYRWRSYLMSSYRTLSRPDLARDLVRRMRDEVDVDGSHGLEQDIIEARYRLYFEDTGEAIERFQSLLPAMRACQDPDRRLEYLGYAAEALSFAPKSASPKILDLAKEAHQLFGQTLGRLSSTPSRKRFRIRHQRMIESVVRMLLGRGSSLESAARQDCLAEAWRLVVSTRIPELQRSRMLLNAEEARKLKNLEDSLHRGMHYYWVEGRDRGQFLEDFLLRVIDFEVAHVKRAQQEVTEVDDLRSADQCLLWLAFRELEPEGTYLLLVKSGKGYQAVWLTGCESLFEELDAWQQYIDDLQLVAPGATLRCRREVSSARSRRKAAKKPDEATVSRAFGRLLGDNLNGSPGENTCDLYPTGPIYTLPLEALPDPARQGFYVGERLATRYCLRPQPRRSGEATLALRGGWLGLGGAPTPRGNAAGFGYLAGSQLEVETLARDLKSRGMSNVVSLTGEAAHLEHLVEALEKHRPSILHLAAHGIGDTEYPDACTLVLAEEPGGAAGVLIPFRSIRNLPVEGVELAILSACWSLVGPTGSGTGVEGLAWALLDAGVEYVLASRYPVSDQHTVTFMGCFYQHIFNWPPAEALRRARTDALRLEGVPLREIGAWALWC